MPKNPSLTQHLRHAAQEILTLTNDCQTFQQAAHKMFLSVESDSVLDNRHEEKALQLEFLNVSIHSGVQMLIDLYMEGAKLEVKQDGI